jgi:hypothetical protein
MQKYVWHSLTSLGDTSVLVPCAILIAFALLQQTSTRRLCAIWLSLFVSAEFVVATTKVLYMGWRLGIPSLDFTGLSGHSTLSLLVWPVAFSLFLGHARRATGVAVGILLASAIALSRLEVRAHSVPEVVLGAVLGIALSCSFLVFYRESLHLVALPRWLAVLLILPLVIGYGRPMPTESILATVARTLSGHSYVFTRADLQSSSSPASGASQRGCTRVTAQGQEPASRGSPARVALFDFPPGFRLIGSSSPRRLQV